MDILKLKKNLVFFVNLKNTEDHLVSNVDMKLLKMEVRRIILYARIAFQLTYIKLMILVIILIIAIHFQIRLYLLKENVIIANLDYLKRA